ncbi:5'-3' exonuclease [Mycoplasma sp. 128]
MKNKRIVVVDGTYLMFKSYYGTLYSNQRLETSTGIKTNALVGFFNTVFKLNNLYQPDHIYFCFDAYGKTFRHEEYSEYKGQRPKAPEDFYTQLVLIKELLTNLNIPTFEYLGFEADDIVATITNQTKNENYVLIFSADQDLNQLIDKSVAILKPKNRDLVVINNKNFYETYGFNPWQVTDYKAIVGDSSDNIKGIKGVGPKTACKLLEKYESVENIYSNIENLDAKMKTKFIEDKELVFKNKFLTHLRDDVPIDFKKLEAEFLDLRISPKAHEILEELELKQIYHRLKDLESN